ncbi:MAG: gamma-glutamyltransferase [Pirellulaceae bacterium]|jgi:gamma-glutamyltranspeptidase/glutathione hydrolase
MLVGCLAIKGPAQDRITGQPFATRSEVIAQHAMAATSQPLATQVALDIMKQGGNAIDAAIAANATLGLMEPTGNGIGGDLFAIVWIQADQKLHGLNASGRSPESLTIERLQEELNKAGRQSIPPTGPLPVSVPGCVDGWFELHRRFGKLPMPQVLAPAIRYAREGFPVSELIAYYWRRSEGLARFPGFAETFLPGGKAPSKGDIFRNPMLAATLQQIADEGRDAFYQGSIAQRIDRFMKQHGGYLSLDDLKKHRSEWVEPVGLDYRGYRVWELPPNSQGLAALQILGMLERFPIAKAGFGSTDHLHWFIEAKKLAFEDRARYYADPEFSKVPIEGLVDREYLNERSRLIGNRSALRYDAGNPALKQGDTIYLTTADPDRNMVSLIQSNYRGFGSGMCPDQLGFCLQDRGELFDPTPGRANSYQPGKRPFHTIIPGFITKDGKPFLSFGVMGGATQPQGHAQIVLNMIDFGMNCQEAGDAPRVVHEGSSEPTGERMEDGGRVSLESGFAAQTIRDLMARGHTLGYDLGNFGGYQAIQYDAQRDIYLGASESRKDGQAAGY